MTVRVPKEVAVFIDSHLTEQIKNRSEFLQHWAQVGVRISDDDELSEALEWALDREVQKPEWDWKQTYAEVTISTETLPAQPPPPDWAALASEQGPAVYEPPRLSLDDRIDGTELVDLQESQLEAMRNNLR